jgi:hypothetical protein
MAGGMPSWKYAANRVLTLLQKRALGAKLSDVPHRFRAYSRDGAARYSLLANSDNFVFDNQVLAQAIAARFAHRRDLVPHLVP